MIALNNHTTRECNTCHKVFVLELGFFSKGNGIYDYSCKNCKAGKEKEREHKKKGYVLVNHSFDNEDFCMRCGLKRRRTARQIKNRWRTEYLVQGKWIEERQKCIIKQPQKLENN